MTGDGVALAMTSLMGYLEYAGRNTMTAAAAKQSHDDHSHFVRPDDMPWEKMRFPGCEVKTLLFDPKSGLATVSAKKKKVRVSLGKKSFKAAAGKVVKLKFKLSKKNLKLVKRLKKIRMTASIAVKDAAGNPKTGKVKFTLKAPKAKKKRK